MNEWRPIETAPRDGSKVLVLYASGTIIISYWVDNVILSYGVKKSEDRYWATPWVTLTDKPDPTHWMPLPDPPSPDVTPSTGE